MPEAEWYEDGLRFECSQCGNCCTGPPGYVWFTEEEAGRIAEHLGLTVAQFRRRYTHPVHGSESLNEVQSEDGYDCIFLRRDDAGKALCSIYPVRPRQCRTWPFWTENLRSSRDWARTARGCPGCNHGELVPIEEIRIRRDGTPNL